MDPQSAIAQRYGFQHLTEEGKNLLVLLHASLGMQTEAAEVADVLKKHLFYGKPLDSIHTAEEVGDCMWYMPAACKALGVSMEAVATANIRKLQARYPQKFSEEAAINRNTETERKALENNLQADRR